MYYVYENIYYDPISPIDQNAHCIYQHLNKVYDTSLN